MKQRFSICNETFGPSMNGEEPDGATWSRVCERIAGFGYDGVEIAPFTFAPDVAEIAPQRRHEIRQVAADNGLEITALHWLFVSPPGLHIHSADDGVRLRSVDYLRSLIDFAGDVGARAMIFGSPAQRRLENGDRQGAWERTLQSYREVLPALKARAVVLCQESLPGPECDFIMTADEAARMVADVDHPNFRLMLDVKSMCGEGREPAEVIRAHGCAIEYFHANDANRRGPGFGDVDFGPIAQALKACGYSKYVSVEVFDYTPDPETIARESLRYLREVFED